jgi:acetolactate synthase-1/2/3 large subunit
MTGKAGVAIATSGPGVSKNLAASAEKMTGIPIHPLRLVAELKQILTPDMTLCSDMGSKIVHPNTLN